MHHPISPSPIPHAGSEPIADQQQASVSALQDQIKQRSRHLEAIALELKAELFGIDEVIDRVLESVRAWYVLPQIITRPVIICLWGLTGTGKTQLTRSLAQKLNFYSRFVEVQMDGFSNTGDQPQARTISAALAGTIEEGTQGILVLDEFQRFRTVDAQGKDVKVERYMDVWALLSDGKMPPSLSFMQELQMALADAQYEQDRTRARREAHNAGRSGPVMTASEALFSGYGHDDGDIDADHEVDHEGADYGADDEGHGLESGANEGAGTAQTANATRPLRRFRLSPYHAKELKTTLKLPESIVEIMTWSTASVMKRLEAFTKDASAWGTDYSKLLIFVCGNLDEMYVQTAARVEDCDTDADIFHAMTLQLSVIDVKRSLLSRFKPEQIARLGNSHVIYPSFSRATFEKLIVASAQRYLDDMQHTSGLRFTLSAQLLEQIYVNGVFPSQGTRPLFSSVHAILSSALVQFTLWALEQGAGPGETVHLDVQIDVHLSKQPEMKLEMKLDGQPDKQSDAHQNSRSAVLPPGAAPTKGASATLLASWKGLVCKLPVGLEISALKQRGDEDFRALLAVHEAGHALVYGLLFGQSPLEIKINPATYAGGYNTLLQRKAHTAGDILNEVCVYMGGRAAELMVFGKSQVTAGASNDIKHATQTLAHYVRYYGFSDRLSRTDRVSDETDAVNTDIMPTNFEIEALIQEQFVRAQTLLTQNRALLLKIARALQHTGELKRDELEEWLQQVGAYGWSKGRTSKGRISKGPDLEDPDVNDPDLNDPGAKSIEVSHGSISPFARLLDDFEQLTQVT